MKSFASAFGPVYLEEAFAELARRLHVNSPSSVFILCDSNTAQYCIPLLSNVISNQGIITIPAGEKYKNIDTSCAIWKRLIHLGADRKSILLNLGGGMVTDIGGFAASCFQRGIRFVHVPTSLLAMTDAAIGGKLGVDFEGNKNYIGLFKAPEFTWINTTFLKTLPRQELLSGLTEIVKHAIIGNKKLWDVVAEIDSVENVKWDEIMLMSIEVKLMIIQEDPLEKGMRKTLNFGHTIGHALESHFLETETPLSHGQAITLGMLAESRMAVEAGLLHKDDFQKIIDLILRLLEPLEVAIPSYSKLKPWLERDKKGTSGQVHFSLPVEIGTCRWDITGLDPRIGLDWLDKQVSGKSFRLMSDPF